MSKKSQRVMVLGTLLLVLIVPVSIGGCAHTSPFLDAQGRTVLGSVALMKQESIGSIQQQLWIRGVSTSNPALVLLHGGPGASEASLFRHFDADLENHFLVVYWEQRGAGRSYHRDIPRDSMTMAQFLDDLDEVVELVRDRYHKDKVILLGHSWGSALGMLYAYKHPEKVAAYVGVGQVANMPAGELASYNFALREAEKVNHSMALRQLEAIGTPPHTVEAMLVSRKWVEHFGGSFSGELSMGYLIWAALRTDEASLVDLYKFDKGNQFSLECLWPEFRDLDLTRYTQFETPIFFLLGRHDWQVPAVVAEEYFDQVEAPGKALVWFENSGHNSPFEEPGKFVEVMVKDVLPAAEQAR